MDDLKKNINEAFTIYKAESGKPIHEKDVRVKIDLAQFFEYYKVINASALANRLGMNQSLLAQYIKGIKKPSPKQTTRILKGVQQLGRELADIQFII